MTFTGQQTNIVWRRAPTVYAGKIIVAAAGGGEYYFDRAYEF